MSTTTRLAEALRALLNRDADAKTLPEYTGAEATAREALADYEEARNGDDRDAIIERAQAKYSDHTDDVEIDEDALIGEADGGAWVQAWVWVATAEDDDE